MPALKYDFRVIGLENVLRSIASIEQRFVQSAARMEAAVGRGRGRGRHDSGEYPIGGGARGPVGRSGAAANNNGDAMAQRAHDAETKRWQRTAQKSADFRIREEQRVAREAERGDKRAADNRRKLGESWSRDEAKRQRDLQGAKRTADREQEHAAQRLKHHEEQRARHAQAQAVAHERWARSTVGGSAYRALGAVGAVGKLAIGAVGIGGGMAVAGALQGAMAAERSGTLLANQAFGTDAARGRTREQLYRGIMNTAQGVGTRTGLGTEKVLGAMGAYHGLAGDVGGAQELAPFLADMALATGSDLTDLGRVAGYTTNALKVKGIEGPESSKKVREIMLGMAGQGKIGTIEMKDLATQMGPLMAQVGRFAGDPVEMAKSLGALAQLSGGTESESSAEAMTSLARFTDDLSEKKEALKKLKIDPFKHDKNGVATSMRNPLDVMADIMVATKGDVGQVGDLFGVRGQRIARPLASLYRERGAGGMRDYISKLTDASMTTPELAASSKFTQDTQAGQFDQLSAEFAREVKSSLFPVLKEMTPKLKEMMPAVASLVKAVGSLASWLAGNPLKGLGALIGAAFIKELAAAQIAKVASSWVSGAAGAGAAGAAGLARSGAGAAGAAGAGAAGAAAKGGLASFLASPQGALAGLTTGASAAYGYGLGGNIADALGASGRTKADASAAGGVAQTILGGALGPIGAVQALVPWATNRLTGSDRDFWESGTQGVEDNGPAGAIARAKQLASVNLRVGAVQASAGAMAQDVKGGQAPIARIEGTEKLGLAGDQLNSAAQALIDAASQLGTAGAGGLNRGGSPTVPR